MKTDFETLKQLASYTINHLKDNQLIEFPVEKRLDLIEAMATEMNASFSTDEDIKTQAIEEVEDKLGDDIPEDITETEMYNHARKEIIKSFNGEAISGLYLVESLNHTAHRIAGFLMDSKLIEDVYASDEDLIPFLVEKIKGFNIKRA